MIQGRSLTFITILLSVIGFISWQFISPKAISIETEQLEQLPGAVIHNMTATQYNENGLPNSHLKSPEVIHYPDSNQNIFIKPHIIAERKDGQPWDITAEKGYSNDNNSEITLLDNVIIYQSGSELNVERRITTDKLIYSTENKIATTDQAIIITQPGVEIRSKGLVAHIESENVELLNEVQATYETA